MIQLFNKTVNDVTPAANDTVDEIYTEDYNVWIKLAFVSCGVISLVTSAVAIIVMARTKKTPYAARFLSKGLLVFDVLYIMTCSVRKFVMAPVPNLHLQVTAQVFLQLSYVTVGLMALERLVVFNWPIAYIRHCTKATVRNVAAAVWLTEVLLFLAVRYGACYLQHSSAMFLQAGMCTQIVSFYYAVVLSLVLITAIFCYCKIFHIVKNQTKHGNYKMSFLSTAKEIKSYKSTFIVMIYMLVIIVTTVAYIIIMILRSSGNLNVTQLRLMIELVTIVNCFLDPYLYVMWFRESQMECLKLVCSCNQRLRTRVERMRTEIYDIVTSEAYKLSASVYPVLFEPVNKETFI